MLHGARFCRPSEKAHCRPVSPYTAFVFLHELAHVVLAHLIKEYEHDTVEREAPRWARKILRVAGIKGSRKQPRYGHWIKPPKLPRHRAIRRRRQPFRQPVPCVSRKFGSIGGLIRDRDFNASNVENRHHATAPGRRAGRSEAHPH